MNNIATILEKDRQSTSVGVLIISSICQNQPMANINHMKRLVAMAPMDAVTFVNAAPTANVANMAIHVNIMGVCPYQCADR